MRYPRTLTWVSLSWARCASSEGRAGLEVEVPSSMLTPTTTQLSGLVQLRVVRTKVKQRFHNHGEGPYEGVLLVESA